MKNATYTRGATRKPEFLSEDEALEVAEVSIKLSRIALVLSTISSAVSFYFLAMALVPKDYRSFETGTGIFANLAVALASLYFAYAVDFYGVQKYAKHSFAELFAIMSRRFYSSLMKKLYTLLSLSVFAVAFMVSFYTSRDGSKMVAGMAQLGDTSLVASGVEGIEKAQSLNNKALRPYEQRLSEATKRMETEIASERARFSKAGEQDWREKKVREKYEAKGGAVYEAKANLDAQRELVAKQDKILMASIEADQSRKINAVGAKAEGIITLLGALGVYPLFIAIALLAIEAVQRVSEQIEDDGEGLGLLDTLAKVFGGKGKA